MMRSIQMLTEPLSAADRATIKHEREAWNHMERQIRDLRELLRDVLDVASSSEQLSPGLIARVRAQAAIGRSSDYE